MSDQVYQPTQEMKDLLVRSASRNVSEAHAAMEEIAVALTLPLREGVLTGNIVGDIFEPVELAPGAPSEFPLDFVTPGTENDFVAYTVPNHGRIPERHVEGDYVVVPAYEVGASVDWLTKYAKRARWDVVGRGMDVMEASFNKKWSTDAWNTIISAGVDRNILVFDEDANNGQFTKRLVSLLKIVMRRNGGGNSTSQNRGFLTDLFISPEAMEDIRNWGVDQIDEVTRREIFTAADGAVNRIFSVNLHDLDELGEGQEFQEFFSTELAGTMAANDVEIVLGLDLSKNDSFVMPFYNPLPDIRVATDLERQRRSGFWGTAEQGWACLDGRRVIVGSM